MLDVMTRLSEMRRPKLLLRAARVGAEDYNREVHLRRHLDAAKLPRNGAALMQLMDIEAELNDRRKRNDAEYPLVTHVDVMIAILGEARVLRASLGVNA